MAIYENDYTKEEDPMLWEIHEIRHQVTEEIERKGITQFNKEALEKWEAFRRERSLAGKR